MYHLVQVAFSKLNLLHTPAGGEDYVPLSETEIFDPFDFQQLFHCVNITIIDDDEVDGLEKFRLVLKTSSQAQLCPVTTVVTINQDTSDGVSMQSVDSLCN